MRRLSAAAIVLATMLGGPVQASLAKTAFAYADENTPGYVIFFSEGPDRLSDVASETIQTAAADADHAAGLVRLVGPADCAEAVRDALVRYGVAANAIRVSERTAEPAAGENADEPATVDIYVEPATAVARDALAAG